MATDAFEEFVVGHGELWCAQLTAAKCRQLGAECSFMDTREVLVVSGCWGPPGHRQSRLAMNRIA